MVIKKGGDRADVGASRRPRRLECGGSGVVVGGGGGDLIPATFVSLSFTLRAVAAFDGGLIIPSLASLSGNLVAADKILDGTN